MIYVGLAGWGDHDAIYAKGTKPRDKLKEYSRKFPIVEVDSTFYAIQSKERFSGWAEETPADFQFIVKAYQGMTGHLRGKPQYENDEQMYEAFGSSLEPILLRKQLKAVLFQYPPWFDCTRDNVQKLRETRARFAGIPCAIEFRNQSWFTPEFREKTLEFMMKFDWIHSICDEPQAGIGSVPTVLHATHPNTTMIRMHGRHTTGWNQQGESNWRDVRYLYDYNDAELLEWKDNILHDLVDQTKDICVIFNNNSGGHASGNAMEFMKMLGVPIPQQIRAEDSTPDQLDLFDQ